MSDGVSKGSQLELEKKYRVDSSDLESAKTQLTDNAQSFYPHKKHDEYYALNDRWFRLRTTHYDEQKTGKQIFSFKEERRIGALELNTEHETEVSSLAVMRKHLLSLGAELLINKFKYGTTYVFEPCLEDRASSFIAELSQVYYKKGEDRVFEGAQLLGIFLEIELLGIPNDRESENDFAVVSKCIEDLAYSTLGMVHNKAEQCSYLHLIDKC